jgi:iron complex transport system substrate-binding protein
MGIEQTEKPTRRDFVMGSGAVCASLIASSFIFSDAVRAFALELNDDRRFGSWGEENQGRIWIDSLDRSVQIPQEIRSIIPSGPYAQEMLEGICPHLLKAVSESQLRADGGELPEVGRLFSRGDDEGFALEEIERISPDVIIDIGGTKESIVETLDGVQDESGIVFIHIDATLDSLPQAYRTLGDLLGIDKAYDFADYVARLLLTFAQGRELLADTEKKKVYFGQGLIGADTQGSTSLHNRVMEMVGAQDAAGDLAGIECRKLPPEYIASWNPDLVVLSLAPSSDDTVDQRFLMNEYWSSTGIAQSARAYLTPSDPYRWFDKPPLQMQTLGALWLAHILYPEVYDYDMASTVRDYYELFFSRNLSHEEASALLDCSVDLVQ